MLKIPHIFLDKNIPVLYLKSECKNKEGGGRRALREAIMFTTVTSFLFGFILKPLYLLFDIIEFSLI